MADGPKTGQPDSTGKPEESQVPPPEGQKAATTEGAATAPAAPEAEGAPDVLAALDEAVLLAHPKIKALLDAHAQREADRRVSQAVRTRDQHWEKQQAEQVRTLQEQQREQWLQNASDEEIAQYVREQGKLNKAVEAAIAERSEALMAQARQQAEADIIVAYGKLLTDAERTDLLKRQSHYQSLGAVWLDEFVKDANELIAERKTKDREPALRRALEESMRAEALKQGVSPDLGKGTAITGGMTRERYESLSLAERNDPANIKAFWDWVQQQKEKG